MNTTLLETLAKARLGLDQVVYVPDQPERGLGATLVWADRHDVDRLHVVTTDVAAAGALARQATYVAEPGVTVWLVDSAEMDEAPPDPVAVPRRVPVDPELVDLLLDAGLEVVVEDGVTRGEVDGLEVARLAGGTGLEVGVGTADRELTAMLHGELAPVDQLRRATAIVRRHRQAGAASHPLNRLVPERWLRAVVCRHPGLVGLDVLRPADSPWPRQNLLDRTSAVATGRTAGAGQPVVVAFSVGIDVDLVPRAADARAALDPGSELWLVVPDRDDHPLTRRLAGRLRDPARVVTVPDHWRSL